MRQACTPPGAHPKASMCTPISMPSAPIAIIYHQHLLHHHYFHSPQPPPLRPSAFSTSAATPSSNTQVSNFQTTPCRHSLSYHLCSAAIINSILYSFHLHPSIILSFSHTHTNPQLAQLHHFFFTHSQFLSSHS